MFRMECAGFYRCFAVGGSRIPRGCRFWNPCGRGRRKWPESMGFQTAKVLRLEYGTLKRLSEQHDLNAT